MKKVMITLAFFATTMATIAQEIQDAVRYSQDNLTGTARFRAMGGAFGALGGDLSSIGVNPAGSAVFMNNQMGFTLTSFNQKNKSNYFGQSKSEKDSSFDFNQLGAVFVFHNDEENSKWKKIALGINYDNNGDFENSVFSAGTNPNTSVAGYFLSYANGIPLGNIVNNPYTSLSYAEQQAYFGYEGYIINPVDEGMDNTLYTSNVPTGNYYQENYVSTKGYNGKLNFNIAAQYDDFLFFGLNLNAHFVDFNRYQSFYESNSNDTENGTQRIRFENDLYTYGNGFSFQLGTIAKVTNDLRVGLAYQSPTWFRLNDEFSQSLAAVNHEEGQAFTDIVNPQIINLYPLYKLQTPGSWTGSLAYVFGQNGLISFDYIIKDYSNTRFKPKSDSYFRDLNNQMSNILDITSEFRVGAEYRIKQLSLRGGYRFEQSPYKNGKTIGDLNALSAGLGYNFGSTKLDLAYTYTKRDLNEAFFSQGLTDPASIRNVNNNVTLTFLFSL
ncbi:MAG: outer membrane protein transport protein [Flavobacteriaceae bacterium]|jgi:hypothetical protein|nr:outer membrane protein transport protein [Flavobacteriaceae bacterium]